MPQITIDIPAAQTDRVVTALAMKIGIAVPPTSPEKLALVKSGIRQFLIDATREYEIQQALNAVVITNVDVT